MKPLPKGPATVLIGEDLLNMATEVEVK